jgi:hypothetical protein
MPYLTLAGVATNSTFPLQIQIVSGTAYLTYFTTSLDLGCPLINLCNLAIGRKGARRGIIQFPFRCTEEENSSGPPTQPFSAPQCWRAVASLRQREKTALPS